MTTSKNIDNNFLNSEQSSSNCNKSDFSIEHILNHAGSTNKSVSFFNKVQDKCEKNEEFLQYSWLNCTRYCPPKLPRSSKREAPQKRQLGRHPRIPFTSHQLTILEEKFKQSQYLGSAEVTQLSRSLQLPDIRVKIWFQNRRARERREKNEVQLKPTYTITNESRTTNESVTMDTNQHFFIQLPSTETSIQSSNQIINSFQFIDQTTRQNNFDTKTLPIFLNNPVRFNRENLINLPKYIPKTPH